MIVTLHDGREGELVGWCRATSARALAGGDIGVEPTPIFLPQILVLEPETIRTIVEVLWEGEPCGSMDYGIEVLRTAVMLAGLCFWPDPESRELSISPWIEDIVRENLEMRSVIRRVRQDLASLRDEIVSEATKLMIDRRARGRV